MFQLRWKEASQIESVIYEDKPYYDVWIKVILAVPLAILLVPGIYYLISNQTEDAMGMFGTAIFMAVVFWVIFPRKFCILDSKVKIVLGSPFSLNIPFNTIKAARVPKGLTLGVNFVTTFSSSHAVEIVRKRWLNVNITPNNRQEFMDNLEKAMKSWSIYYQRVP